MAVWLLNPPREGKKMVKRRRKGKRRQPAALRRYWATHKRGRKKARKESYARFYRATRKRRRRKGFAHLLPRKTRGFRKTMRRGHMVKSYTMRRKGRSIHVRGHRSNPFLAEYLMNPRRHHRKNRRHRRHHYSNPGRGLVGSLTKPFSVGYLMEGLAGVGGMYLTITGGNMLLGFAQGFIPASFQTGIFGTVVKTASRSVVAMLADRFVPWGRNRNAARIGAVIGVAGSAIFDLLGYTFWVGSGDSNQGIGNIVGMAGIGAYVPAAGIHRGMLGTGAYVRSPRLSGSGMAGPRIYGGGWKT